VSDGQVYLSAQADCNLPFEVYGKLPNYQAATWEYNGVDIESLTDEDMQHFYKACCAYAQECIDTEAETKYPTLEELTEQCEKLWAKHNREYAEAQKIVSDSVITGDFLKLSKYQLETVHRYLLNLSNQVKNNDPKVRPQLLLGKSGSFGFMKPDLSELIHEDYYLKSIKEIFFEEIRR
jgi:hypothetical protein